MKSKILKYKYVIYLICLAVNIPFAISGYRLNCFTIGWTTAIIFFELIRDEII